MPGLHCASTPLRQMAGKSRESAVVWDRLGRVGDVESPWQDSGEPPLGGVVNHPPAALSVQSSCIRNIAQPTSCHCLQWRSLLGEIVQRGSTKR
jgi:hypothetical protein